MKFLVDAQLPRMLAHLIRAHGHDVVHTLDLPDANGTSDSRIIEVCIAENRIVVTKDADFVSSFLLVRRPEKLLLISTGNITNNELQALLIPNLPAIVDAFSSMSFVELNRISLVLHT